jgi:hypothetical protein
VKRSWQDTNTSSQTTVPNFRVEVVTINNDANASRRITIDASDMAATPHTSHTHRLDVLFQDTVCFTLGLNVESESDGT